MAGRANREPPLIHVTSSLARQVIELRRWYVANRDELTVDEERIILHAINQIGDVSADLVKRYGYVYKRRR